MKRKNGFYLLIALPSLIVTLVIFVFPLVSVLRESLTTDESLVETVKSAYTWRLFSFTFVQALLSAVISTAIAVPFAFFFSSYTFPGRGLVLSIADTAFVLPSVIVVLGFVIWYGNNGILNTLLSSLTCGKLKLSILYSYSAIILAHVYLNFPLAFSVLTSGMITVGAREETAARFLGKGRMKVFFSVTLPKIKGSIYQTLLVIFLFCFPSFLIVMTLGGSPKYYTVEAEIYRRAYSEGNLASASSLAICSFAVMAVIMLLTGWGRKEKKTAKTRKTLKKAKGGKAFLAFVLSLIVILFMLPPLLSIVYRSFCTRDGVFTLKTWKALFTVQSETVLTAIISSALIALLSSWVAVRMATALSLSASRRNDRLLPLLSSLPLAAGSVTLGLGFSYLSSFLGTRSTVLSFLMTLLAHTTVTLPFAIRTILPGAQRLSPSLLYSSLTLSSSHLKSYRKVEVPMLKSYRKKAFAFAFALSLGETNATLSLGSGRITTLPTLIYRMIEQYNYQGASALSLILLVVSLTVFSLSERGGRKNGLS